VPPGEAEQCQADPQRTFTMLPIGGGTEEAWLEAERIRDRCKQRRQSICRCVPTEQLIRP
jgi:hypothetical protein